MLFWQLDDGRACKIKVEVPVEVHAVALLWRGRVWRVAATVLSPQSCINLTRVSHLF